MILNISTTSAQEIDADSSMKLIAATMSSLSEYLFNSTWKIQKAATAALKLIVSHGVSKVAVTNVQNTQGFEKVCANIRYLISSRFTDSGHGAALGNSLSVITTCVEKVQLSDQALCELLAMVSKLKVGRHQYTTWTNCIGAFMGKMGAYKFFKVLPL